MEINYPESFKNKCRKQYPQWTELHQCLNLNLYVVGMMLRSKCKDPSISNYIILTNSLENLRQMCEVSKAKFLLSFEWQDYIPYNYQTGENE
jgi:hypothetical protein